MRSTCFAPCYRSAQLQSPSPLYVCRAGGTRGARGIVPPDSKSNTCSMKRINCIIASPTQVSDLPPALYVREKASIHGRSRITIWARIQFVILAKKTCVPSNLHKMFYSSYNHVNMWPQSREQRFFFLYFYINFSWIYFNYLAENSFTMHVQCTYI